MKRPSRFNSYVEGNKQALKKGICGETGWENVNAYSSMVAANSSF